MREGNSRDTGRESAEVWQDWRMWEEDRVVADPAGAETVM